jgi:hypothetical protein
MFVGFHDSNEIKSIVINDVQNFTVFNTFKIYPIILNYALFLDATCCSSCSWCCPNLTIS